MKAHHRTSSRRSFIQHAALAGGSLLFLADRARGATEPAAGATNATLDTIHRARTTHGNFTAREIPEDVLQAIIGASLRAPGASNMQSYSIIVVRERDRMKRLCGYAGSRTLVYCIDFNRLTATAAHLGHAYQPHGVDSLLIGCVNTTLAIQNATLAARSLGVDYLITNGIHRGDMDRVWKTLELPPALCFPLAAVVLGYPTAESAHQRGRLTGAGVVHEGTYHRLTPAELDALVQQHDAPESHLALNDDWRSQGHKHYLDWLFTAWLGRGGPPAGQESQVTRLLRRSGFVDAATT